ncbi:hypothetical protein HN873_055604, partial [Arachis hypogaea]
HHSFRGGKASIPNKRVDSQALSPTNLKRETPQAVPSVADHRHPHRYSCSFVSQISIARFDFYRQGRNENMAEPAAPSSLKPSLIVAGKSDAEIGEVWHFWRLLLESLKVELLQGVVGLVFGNESSYAYSYVKWLLDRISNGKLANERRNAIIELQAIVSENQASQLEFGATGLGPDPQVRGALETLVSALTPINHGKGSSNEVQLALMNTDLLSREADIISLLLSLLKEDDFYVRYYTLQLLTALLSNSPQSKDTCWIPLQVVGSYIDHPSWNNTANGYAHGSRVYLYVIRNEALLLLTHLTRAAEEIQKIVVFEGVFEKIFRIIREEGNSDGGVVVQVLLRETIGLDSLISILKLRGSAFSFTQQKARFFQIFA